MDHYIIDKDRGRLLIQASRDAGCKTALVRDEICAQNLSNEDKLKILQDLKEIATIDVHCPKRLLRNDIAQHRNETDHEKGRKKH